MAKTFRAREVDPVWMLPATVQEFVPENHAAHLVRETAREDVDLPMDFRDSCSSSRSPGPQTPRRTRVPQAESTESGAPASPCVRRVYQELVPG